MARSRRFDRVQQNDGAIACLNPRQKRALLIFALGHIADRVDGCEQNAAEGHEPYKPCARPAAYESRGGHLMCGSCRAEYFDDHDGKSRRIPSHRRDHPATTREHRLSRDMVDAIDAAEVVSLPLDRQRRG